MKIKLFDGLVMEIHGENVDIKGKRNKDGVIAETTVADAIEAFEDAYALVRAAAVLNSYRKV